jgi:tetratricopeptide (TPR) repeat protein
VIRTALLPLVVLPFAAAAAAPSAAAAQQGGQPAQELPEPVKRIRQLYVTYEDEEALHACNEYLVTHPGDPIVLEFRARCLRQLGRLEEAAKTAAAILPPHPRLKLLQAECLGVNKATADQAHALVDEVASEDPNAIDPHLSRARIYLAQARIKEASAELDYVRTTAPRLFEAQLLAGFLAEMTGRFDEALKLYVPLVTKGSEFERTDTHHDRDAVMALAACYMKLQQYADATSLYEQLSARFPKSAFVLLQLAAAQSMLDRNAEAMATLEKCVQLAPAQSEARLKLAELYNQAGRQDDAIAQCQKILELGATGVPQVLADLRLAELYLDRSDLERAKAHAQAALAAAPDHEEALTLYARVREKVGDVNEAKESYRKALAKNPLMLDAMYRLGLLLARSEDPGEQEESQKLLTRHKRIEPFILDIRRTQKELEFNPRSPLLLTRLAGFLNLAGEYDQARRWAEISDKLHSRSPSTCIQLAYISANLGDNASALKYFERAQQMLGKGTVPEIDEYIEKLKKGEPLPLPMGRLYRPAQKRPEDGGAPAASDDPPPGAAKASTGGGR